MPRKPKAKDGLTAGERAALYESSLAEKLARMKSGGEDGQQEHKEPLADEKNEQNNTTPPEKDGTRVKTADLPKPTRATVKVDFSLPYGEIKALHGMCNGPISYGTDISEFYRLIGVPFVRFEEPIGALSTLSADISEIFKNTEADPADPESYDFSYLDESVKGAMLVGSRVVLRIGESSEIFQRVKKRQHFENKDTLQRACVNIIRHYRDGWANGYSFDIELVELWQAGDDREADFEIYRLLSNAVKLYNEELKVGGMSFSDFDDGVKDFLRYCKKNRVPVDFLSIDSFSENPETVFKRAETLTAAIKNAGLDSLELIVGKWCYAGSDGADISRLFAKNEGNDDEKRNFIERLRGIEGAAYAAAWLLRMSDVQNIKTACFYDAHSISPLCSLCDAYGKSEKPYYAFMAYGELYRAKRRVFAESEQTAGCSHNGIYVLSALSDEDEGYIMLSSYGGCGTVDLRIEGISNRMLFADIHMLDGVKNLSLCDTISLSGMKKRILLNVSEYGVILIKLKHK